MTPYLYSYRILRHTIHQKIVELVHCKAILPEWLVFITSLDTNPSRDEMLKMLQPFTVKLPNLEAIDEKKDDKVYLSTNKSVSVTFLSLCVIFNKPTIFSLQFEYLVKSERSAILRLKTRNFDQHFSIWEILSTTNMVAKFVNKHNCVSDKITNICRLTRLLSPVHNRCISQVYDIMIGSCLSGTELLAAMVVVEPRVFPVLSIRLIESIDLQCLPGYLTTEELATHIPRILSFLITNSRRKELVRWTGPYIDQVLGLMQHSIQPFMDALFTRSTRRLSAPASLRVAATGGLAYIVDFNTIQKITVFECKKWVHFCFSIHSADKPKQLQVLLSVKDCVAYGLGLIFGIESEFVRHFPNETLSKKLVYIHKGAYTNHPLLKTIVSNFEGRGNSLCKRSSGVLVEISQLSRDFPSIQAQPHGTDITTQLNLKRRKRRSNKSVIAMADHIPYHTRCHLTFQELMQFSNLFQRFTSYQKYIFYLLFWNLKGVSLTISKWQKNSNIIEFVKFCLDQIVDVLCDANMKRHIISKKKIKLWLKLMPIENVLDFPHRAIINVLSHHPGRIIVPIVNARFRTKELKVVFQLSLLANLNATPVQGLNNMHLLDMFTSVGIPYNVKRVVYQCMIFNNFVHHTNTYPAPHWHDDGSFSDDGAFAGYHPRTSMYLIAPSYDGNCECLYFDRETGNMQKKARLRQYIGSQPFPQHFELAVSGEEGRGQSVYEEVLNKVWETAISSNLASQYSDDGFCVGFGLDVDNYLDDAFMLGFISGLCVVRGLYLPFPLDPSWWKYLCLQNSTISYIDVFSKYQHYVTMTQHLSDQEFADVLGVTYEDVVQNGRSFHVKQFSIPNHAILREFKNGWDIFCSYINIGSLSGEELTRIFCEPVNAGIITISGFLETFTCQNDVGEEEEEEKSPDFRFLKYVQTLSQHKLETLVYFITGKHRLPLPGRGEYTISVAWIPITQHKQPTMPKSQNCSNLLILPAAISNFDLFMDPIYQFPTVFGFA